MNGGEYSEILAFRSDALEIGFAYLSRYPFLRADSKNGGSTPRRVCERACACIVNVGCGNLRGGANSADVRNVFTVADCGKPARVYREQCKWRRLIRFKPPILPPWLFGKGGEPDLRVCTPI